jgi:hypothetical protein
VAAVQSYINSTSLTTHTTAAFDSTGGDLVVMLASSHAGVTFTPTDALGNIWITIAGPTSTSVGFDMRTQVWYARNPIVGPGDTVTMSLSAAAFGHLNHRLERYEWFLTNRSHIPDRQ